MKFAKTITALLLWILLFESASPCFGFALLGPVAPWMQESNGVINSDDIGGPMEIGSGYRWNVPVITYGFDKSFLDYFGSNGVAAVENAIQILNDLPPASQIVLTNFPLNSRQNNYLAQVQGIYDLKSQTLSSLIEQLGLTQPTRDTFVLKQWTPLFTQCGYDYALSPCCSVLIQEMWQEWAIPDYIGQFNFDPEAYRSSPYVNGNLETAYIRDWASSSGRLVVYPADIFSPLDSAVADKQLASGEFYTGLTYDDVGGLRYLLRADNVNFEELLPHTLLVGAKNSRIVNGAWRPGVAKINFIRQPNIGKQGGSRPFVSRYTDFYWDNNVLKQQTVARVVLKPDILFCAADNGEASTNLYPPLIVRTGTTRWLNNAASNGNTNSEGPGVIAPPVKIAFHKLGGYVVTYDGVPDAEFYPGGWGSFGASIGFNDLTFVAAHKNQPLAIRFNFEASAYPYALITNQVWHLKIPIGAVALLQDSTDQINWNTLATVTNKGSVIQWAHVGVNNPPKSFRAISQHDSLLNSRHPKIDTAPPRL